MEIAGDIEYEVEEVLAVKKQWNQLKYRVKWKGYEEEDLEWYSPSDLKGHHTNSKPSTSTTQHFLAPQLG